MIRFLIDVVVGTVFFTGLSYLALLVLLVAE